MSQSPARERLLCVSIRSYRLAGLRAVVLAVMFLSASRIDATDLPPDPFDAVKLQNDLLGVRVWGPASRPTLSIGRADIWDRRWYGDRQPLIALSKIRELALADRIADIGKDPNAGIYDVYKKYDFPCPKPGAQLILGTPFATNVESEPDGPLGVRLNVQGVGKRLTVHVWILASRPLVVAECQAEGLDPNDCWLRVYRHHDTITPGGLAASGKPSAVDFERMVAPESFQSETVLGISQLFPAEMTFPDGFRVIAAATVLGTEPKVICQQNERGLGTSLWAEKEGRLNHGVLKRYTPINEATGAAATATFSDLPKSFVVLATIATSQDGADPMAVASQTLAEAKALGLAGLKREQAETLGRGKRHAPALVRVDGKTVLAAPDVALPSPRRPDGYYGDVPLCSVGSTKFCFQDTGLWHDDFHLNEIHAEGMLTLGQFAELLTYCRMIHTMLPQTQENARDVYGLPGAMYPLVHFPLRCRGVAHANLTWEQDMGLNGLVSKPLWLYYRYTGDTAYLREVAYPVLRECARFMFAYISEESDGRLHLVPSVSPEHWGLTNQFERNRDCTSALTLTRYLLRSAAAAAEILGENNAAEIAAWRQAAERLAPYPTHEGPSGSVWVDVAGTPPIEYNIPVPLSPVFWGDDLGLDSPPEAIALANRTLEQIRVWEPHRFYLDRFVRPRLGIYRPGADLGPENFLLSYQSIRLFPAVPSGAEIAADNLCAEGGFRVSAKRAPTGEVHDVRITSTLGGPCRVANPWPGQEVEITSAGGRTQVARKEADSHCVFLTEPEQTYSVHPYNLSGKTTPPVTSIPPVGFVRLRKNARN